MHQQSTSTTSVLTSATISQDAGPCQVTRPGCCVLAESGVQNGVHAETPFSLSGRDGSVPPSSNTGVEVTQDCLTNTPTACIDWLSFTFSDETSFSDVQRIFGARQWDRLERGRHGYRSGVVSGDIVVLFEGRPGMGTHVVLSGRACRQLEEEGTITEWQDFVHFIVHHGASISRLDIAWDDTAGQIDLQQVEQYARSGQVCTHFQKVQYLESGSLTGHDRPGKTVSFGSRSSSVYVRMYDKAAQLQEEGHRIRVEIEVKDDRAQAVAQEFITGGFERMAGFLAATIDFREKGEHCNRSRWNRAAWWQAFLDGAEKARITLQRVKKTVEEVRDWIRKQVAPSLALLFLTDGSDALKKHMQMIEEGKRRLRLDRYITEGVNYAGACV